jgi:hypothetical protein
MALDRLAFKDNLAFKSAGTILVHSNRLMLFLTSP